jgi:hypothetical protein
MPPPRPALEQSELIHPHLTLRPLISFGVNEKEGYIRGMKNPTLNRALAYMMLAVLLLLAIDSYVAPPPVLKIFTQDYTRIEGNSVAFYIVGNSGEGYKVPSNTDMSLEKGDTFFVRKSGIFDKMLSITYPGPNKHLKTYNMGVMRSMLGFILAPLALGIAIPNAGKKRIIKDVELNGRLLIAGIFLTVILAYAHLR